MKRTNHVSVKFVIHILKKGSTPELKEIFILKILMKHLYKIGLRTSK